MPRGDYKHDCPCPHHPFECFGHPNTCPCATEAVAWQWRYVGEGDHEWKTPSGGTKLTAEELKRERPIEQRPLFTRS